MLQRELQRRDVPVRLTDLEYTEPPASAQARDVDLRAVTPELAEYVARFTDVRPREPDRDGARERLGTVEVVHRFVEATGDSELVRWHLVEAGAGDPIVFLHGLPESWYVLENPTATTAAIREFLAG